MAVVGGGHCSLNYTAYKHGFRPVFKEWSGACIMNEKGVEGFANNVTLGGKFRFRPGLQVTFCRY